MAHSLRGISEPPPVTLLLHRPTWLQQFKEQGNTITVQTDGVVDTRSGFDAELALPDRARAGRQPRRGGFAPKDRAKFATFSGEDTIHNLIVTTKAPAVVSAIDAIKHRLLPTSTILFLQNGMGIVEEVNRELYPTLDLRPNYMLGINSHGLNSSSNFSVNHAGHGIISLGLVPRIPFAELAAINSKNTKIYGRKEEIWAPSSRYLLRTITRTPILAAVALSPTELLQAQLEKLAVNCLINPMTVLLDAPNGAILQNFSLTRVRTLLLAEICAVIQSLPELKGVPNIQQRFAPARLEALTVRIASRTAKNVSSMLADARRGMKTEIEYMNGYIVKRGEELGIRAVMNYMLMHLVHGKYQMISREIDDYVPFPQTSDSKSQMSEEPEDEKV